jgi:hypothetical protein
MDTNHQTQEEQCWFCGKLPTSAEFAAIVEMHKGGFVGKSTHYQVIDKTSLAVPRCEACKSVHDRVEGRVAKGGVLGLLIGVVAAFFAFYYFSDPLSIKDDWRDLLILIAIFGMIGGVIGWMLGRTVIPKGVKDQRAREKHPFVQQKVQEGWKIGPKPVGL